MMPDFFAISSMTTSPSRKSFAIASGGAYSWSMPMFRSLVAIAGSLAALATAGTSAAITSAGTPAGA